MDSASDTADTSAREIVFSRVIKAQRDVVFDAFLDVDNITEWWSPKTYTEVAPPERLRYQHDSDTSDDAGSYPVTITFTDRGAKTEVAVRSLYPTVEACNAAKTSGAAEDGNLMLQRLGEYLSNR